MKPLLCLNILLSSVVAISNGVGKLPKMGYNTFNAFGCNYNEENVSAIAQSMTEEGLVEAGYNSIIFDDCFTMKERSNIGELQEDYERFPSGMRNLTDRLKELGISASAYSDAGYKTCGGYPGSYGHEEQDLRTFRKWGFDYLKYDNCYIPFDNITQENVYGRYARMANTIAAEAMETKNAPFWFSLCEWGWQQPWSALTAIIDNASFHYWATNFYGHNDMDILEVGNTGQGDPVGNLTIDEAKSYFTAWALLKSPLLISTNLVNASQEAREILKNHDLIKINQDPNVGESISPFRWGNNQPDYVSNATHPAQFWSGNSSYGVVFMLLNTLDTQQDMFVNLTESWAIRAGRLYDVFDMWTHTRNGTVMRNMTVTLPPHGVAALLLNDAGPEPEPSMLGLPYCGVYYQCTWPNGSYYSN
ncbi:glycoside hydrolase family 27 protein [Lophiostoma macrostomum CBS 122681]|uniref:Alpha-galactosidase n=1 Tax=Lophiostoma macrostomum CBS 122681 TaxID=1314788 RepID=A0A6A6SLH4_9PLEO|nr:glycoside hydrolase family 27 protein [Lophiostoma macrostomum CBS 122681]